MFKKPLDVKGQQRLSGADRKKLRRTINDKFSHVSDEDIDLLLPPKSELTVAKLHNRVLVYYVEGGIPMFFDIGGRGTDFFPTVFALWEVPLLLPSLVLKSGEVSRYIINGADLMFPGVDASKETLPLFSPGESWSVRVPLNDAPIAVGITAMSSKEAEAAGMRGKALRIVHSYRDLLWDSVTGRHVPNAGFLDDVVNADPTGVGHGEAQPPGVSSEQTDEPEQTAAVTETISAEQMDRLLVRCLLQALHTTVTDADLPLAGSVLWSAHVLPCRPEGVTLDVKKSPHKKVSKWLHSVSSSGLITLREDKYSKDLFLLSVERSHPDYLSFRPEKRRPDCTAAVSPPHEVVALRVEEFYKASVHVAPVMESVGADVSTFFTMPEASEVAFRYVEKHGLVKATDKAVVVVDTLLCDALFKGTLKKGSRYPTEIHKRDLGSAFTGRMHRWHRVTRGGDSFDCKGALRSVQITTERRQGNKKVTRLSGLEGFLVGPDTLASELQKKFACSTTIVQLPGKKGEEVLVQGGVIDDLANHLMENLGIPKKYIEVWDKTKK